MRYLLLLFLSVLQFSSFAQQSALDSVVLQEIETRTIVNKLNVLLKDSLIRGKSYGKVFSLSQKTITGNSYLDSIILSVLLENRDLKGSYYTHIYWDHYSDQVYSSLAKSAEIEERGFPNYDNYEASPSGGYKKFRDSLKVDLLELFTNEDWYAENAFSSELNVLVDKSGYVQYMLNNKVQNLRRSDKLKWSPALYYGQPRNYFLRIPLLKKYNNGKISDIIIEDNFSVGITYLDKKYKEKIVRIEPFTWYTQIPRGNVVVSFVYNAAFKSFENPKIHQGEFGEAKDLIRWITAYSFAGYIFNWENWPESNRYYFYIN